MSEAGDDGIATAFSLDGSADSGSEKLLQAVVEHSDHVIFVTDRNGTIQFVNSAFESVTGYSKSEAIGKTPSLLSSGEHDETYYERLWQTIASGETWEEEIIDERKTDDRYHAVQTIAPVSMGADEITHFVAIQREITERKEREKELEAFREAVEQAGHSIYWTDTDGKIQYVNPAFEEITGFSKERAVGNTPRILKSGEMSEAYYETLWDTILAGDVFEGEVTNKRADGETFVIKQTVSPITNENGEIERFVSVNTDITERKRRELQLERERDRSQELQHRLTVINRILRHDIREAVNVIRGHVDLLSSHMDDATEHFAAINNVTDRINRIAENARKTVATLEQGMPEEVRDVSTIVESVVEEYRQDHDDVAFHTALEADIATETVPGLRHAVENLVSNAIHHNDADDPAVAVVLQVAATASDRAELIVVDNGPGIPETELETLEQGFETQLTHLSGFGLWQVKWTVEEIGGEVTFRSVPGSGTAVEISLPCAPADDASGKCRSSE